MPHRKTPRSRPSGARLLLFTAVISAAALVSFTGAGARLRPRQLSPDEASGAQAQADFLRVVPLPAGDVVYNAADQTLYASVPGSAGAAGNSIAPVNPATGEVGAPVFVGSDPSKLAMADDGRTLYAFLEGAYSVRRFDTQTRTPGLQFSLGQESFLGIYRANDLAVAPGNPNVVAVARYFLGTSPPEAGVAIFDNGVQRAKTGPGHTDGANSLVFSAAESKLYGGGDNALKAMTIDATGVASIANVTTFQVGLVIKLAGGRVYSSNGQVVDPDTGSQLGTFSGVNGFSLAPDPANGRIYYLGRDNFGNGALTLKAFDINTFVLVGSTILSGVNGNPTTLVRWGSNGLAFRTDANQLCLLQTSLIPSADPVPTPTVTPAPTATPTPTPPATFVRQLPLATNDLVYNPQSQLLYASVPSGAGAPRGNSVTRIDPVAGAIGSSTFVGSEPGRLALADDNQTMYVALNGANAVRRFDASSQTAGLQFSLGNSSFDGPFRADDIAVMPGSPGTVAVSRNASGSGGTSIYDDGVARARVAANGSNSAGGIEFGSPSRLYAGSGPVVTYSVAADGLTQVKSMLTGANGTAQFAGGLLYLSGGAVVDPEAGVVKGRFGSTSLASDSLMTVDAAQGRVYFLTHDFNTSSWVLRSFDTNTYRPIAAVTIQGVDTGILSAGLSSLVRWGKNGLAFRTPTRVFLIQTALVDSTEPVASPTPTPAATATPTPTPIPTLVRKVDLAANDLVVNPATQTLYASVPSTAGARGNSVTAINPQEATLGASTFVGSEPNRLAISDDAQLIYVGIDGASAVRRVDLATQTAAQQFALGNSQFGGPLRANDIAVAPGQPTVVAVSRRNTCCSPSHEGVAVFDNGVMRSQTTPGHTGANVIEFSASPTTLYGYNNETTEFGFRKMTVNASGVSVTSTVSGLLSGFGSDIKFAGGRVYATSGRVIEPEGGTVFGTFNGGGNLVAVDLPLRRAFFLGSGNSGGALTLTAFDIDTFLPLGSVQIPGVTGTLSGLVRWGVNGLAFNTIKQPFDTNATSQIYLIQSALVSDAVPIPSALQFSAANYSAFESANSVTVTVTRTGGISAPVSINYATGGGTATPGSDYTAVSGTLAFAAGETTKTFAVPLLDDNVFEGVETVGLTLSAPTDGALLGTQPAATLTIQDNESRPSVSPVSLTILEGNSGTTSANLTVRLSNATTQTVTVNYKTTDGTATAGSDYVAAAGSLTFAPGETEKTIALQIVADTVDEPNENFFVDFSNAVNADAFQRAVVTILADEKDIVQFASSLVVVSESATRAAVNITRGGDLSSTVTVRVRTVDNPAAVRCDDTTALPSVAFARCDYATAVETLTFAPGEATKTSFVSIINDVFAEPDENVQLALTSLSAAAQIGTPGTMTLRIVSDDPSTPQASANPVLQSDFFVRQQYLDFFGREPDAGGFNAWKGTLDNCPDPFNSSPSAPSANCDRVAVSTKFFRSKEFELKGGYVFNFYKVAFGRLPRYSEIVVDMASLTAPTDAEFFARKAAFTGSFVQRQEFRSLYDAMANAQLVNALMDRYGLQQITTPDPAAPDDTSAKITLTRADLAGRLDAGTLTRSQLVRALADSNEVTAAEANSSFVAMQYFGYLRRDPDQGGYDAWLRTIDLNPADIRSLVNGFMNSTEYRLRFGTP